MIVVMVEVAPNMASGDNRGQWRRIYCMKTCVIETEEDQGGEGNYDMDRKKGVDKGRVLSSLVAYVPHLRLLRV